MVTRPTEQFVEDLVIAQCAAAGISTRRGVELDDSRRPLLNGRVRAHDAALAMGN